MNQDVFNEAVENNHPALNEILEASYLLVPMSKHETYQLANSVNNQLGKTLFTDMYYPSLVRDFSIISRALQIKSK